MADEAKMENLYSFLYLFQCHFFALELTLEQIASPSFGLLREFLNS